MDKVLFIVGPTAAGKTEYAIRAAEEFGGEIVSCDSVQIYRYMDIGSAKPTAEERRRAVHWLVDCLDPLKPVSVAEYRRMAKDAIRDIQRRGKLAIVTGGTGLYVNSLLYKLDFGRSEADLTIRDCLNREAEEKGGTVLYERLSALDPDAASRIEPANTRRVIRALELLETTGSALGDFGGSFVPTDDYEPVLVGITRPRAELIDRIDRRVNAMFEKGLIDEVRKLLDLGLTRDSQPMQAIGYKEIVDAIEGRAIDIHGEPLPAGSPETLEAARDLIKIHTRQYAKRQMTWFKRLPGIRWYDVSEPASVDAFLADCALLLNARPNERTGG